MRVGYVSVDPVLYGCVVQMGGVQYAAPHAPLGGFRALKKTPEAPYTTKVNYRKCTSRGTTQIKIILIYLYDTLSHCDNGQMIMKVTLAIAYKSPALVSASVAAVIVPPPHIAFIAPASKYLYVSVEAPT